MRVLPAWLVLVLVAWGTVTSGTAQCAPLWLPGDGVHGTDGYVQTTATWDPDGVGPLPARLVIGGSFTVAGDVSAYGIASYEPVTGAWFAFGAGVLGGAVNALATLPNGDLVAAGQFTTAGGLAASRIARWNGSTWAPLGSGFDGPVYALAVLPSGDLIAGGYFASAGGTGANSIARWNGSAWMAMGSGFGGAPGGTLNGVVVDLLVTTAGELIAAGQFWTAGGAPANNVARWNGSAWSQFGGGLAPGLNAYVLALAQLPNGDLVAGGTFAAANGGAPGEHIVRWNGTAWQPLAAGADGAVAALTILPNGDLVAAGGFHTAGGIVAERVARWDGAVWSALGGGCDDDVFVLGLAPSGALVAGGRFGRAGGRIAATIATWDGTQWSPLARGLDNEVAAVLPLPDDSLVVGGYFTAIGGADIAHVARFDGFTWQPLGAGLDGPVRALARLPNGDLVAGGVFAAAGATPLANVARWDGSSWSPLGSGTSHSVDVLAVLANGDLVAGGTFTVAGGIACARIARWDGVAWSPFGSGVDDRVAALLPRANGELIAGGSFFTAGGTVCRGIAQWDGANWLPLGPGFNGVLVGQPAQVAALAELAGGELVAGGWFQSSGTVITSRIARWNGFGWSDVGGGITGNAYSDVEALHVLPNGDLLAGGMFAAAGGVAASNVARWDGTAWSAADGGVDGPVRGLAWVDAGRIVAGGAFLRAGAQVSARLATLAATCPATSATSGNGCTGAGGPNVLTATSLPWLGGTLASRATGMPAGSLAVSVLGLVPVSIPLAMLLAAGQPGCDLLVSPDLLDLLVPVAGSVSPSRAIPNAVALVGQTLRQQVVAIELGAGGAFVALTSTNALVLTIGDF